MFSNSLTLFMVKRYKKQSHFQPELRYKQGLLVNCLVSQTELFGAYVLAKLWYLPMYQRQKTGNTMDINS